MQPKFLSDAILSAGAAFVDCQKYYLTYYVHATRSGDSGEHSKKGTPGATELCGSLSPHAQRSYPTGLPILRSALVFEEKSALEEALQARRDLRAPLAPPCGDQRGNLVGN